MRRSPLPVATCLLLAVALAVGDDADRQADEVLLLQSSHQDIAWMDDPAACRRFRVRENVVPALELVSEEPAARFTVECAAYLAEALEDLPARREEILEASRAGGLEWGATWNQPYEGLLTGEQLARQLLYGRGWLLREHGIDAKVAFNLDVPSRARQWPQLLAKAGVTGLATGRMPAGAWRWRSPDGSAVVAWSPGHYNRGQVRLKYHEGTLAEWAAPLVDGWRRWRGAAGLPPTVPLPLLHTGDCSRPLSFAPLTTAGGFEGARVRSARFDELFAALGAVADRLPELDGIRPNPWCYIHGPGHHRAIAAKRRAARLLSAAELAALAARMQAGASYPQERLRRAWLDSLADDHGWGGKDGEITDAHFRERLEVAATEAEAVIDEAMAALAAGAGPGRGVLVFNPEARPRGGLVTCPPPPPDTAWCGPDGTALPQQILEEDGLRRCLVAVEEIPAGGRLVLRPGPAMAADGALPTIGPEGGVTPHLELRLVPGGIAAVADRASGRDLVAADGTWGEVLLYDSPGKDVMGDWQVVAPKAVLARGAEVFGPWRVTARGPLLTELAADGAFGEVPLRRRLRVHHLRPRLDLALEVDWDGTPDRELRWIFPVAAAGPVTLKAAVAPHLPTILLSRYFNNLPRRIVEICGTTATFARSPYG